MRPKLLLSKKKGNRMKKLTFIWDLDGTLIDSYVPIMEALEETYRHFGLIFD
ncbi:HAD family hydrolase, partial [Streptococcus agalactiae]|nr:HAD family hydrolase [Streptococcus agalactiae]MCK6291175.1 HAD family hydrolase [Streptococcus agalactiae]MCK6326603.1 HAD family hydrolase [Streptococcus agalactiae]MCK6328874.1 HAD family hydrolase [Streptococcus agalactiae]MCK6347682.1 HAD family hydrolase [Streptococcus agalactiae]